MKHLKSYKIFERLKFDVDDVDDILIDIVDNGFMYHVELDWYEGTDEEGDWMESVKVTIWKKGTNISPSDLDSIKEDIFRLVDFMKQNEYSVRDTYPSRLLSVGRMKGDFPLLKMILGTRGSVDKIMIQFSKIK